MAYTTITAATIGLADGDTSPQRLDGTVRITPRFPSAATADGFTVSGPVVVSVAGGDMPQTVIPAIVDATGLVEFHLYDRNAGPVKMPPTEIPLEPDTTISLHDYLPLGTDPSTGALMVRGPRGYGLQDITAADGMITFQWDDSKSTHVAVPESVPGEDGSRGPKGDSGDVRFEGVAPAITVRTDDVLVGDTAVPSVPAMSTAIDAAKWLRPRLTSLSDADSLTGSDAQGVYVVNSSSVSGLPESIHGLLEVSYIPTSGRTRHEFKPIRPGTPAVWARVHSASAWSEWVPITWSQNILGNGIDFDSVRDPGIRPVQRTDHPNQPVPTVGALETIPATGRVIQRFTTWEYTPRVLVRIATTETEWATWKEPGSVDGEKIDAIESQLATVPLGPTRQQIEAPTATVQSKSGAQILTSLSLDRSHGWNCYTSELLRSWDDGRTWEDVATETNPFAGSTIESVMQLDNGELLVTNSIGVEDRRAVWVSSGYDSGDPVFTRTLTAHAQYVKFTSAWSIHAHGRIVLINDYGPKVPEWVGNPVAEGDNARYTHLSMDYGRTWTTVFDLNEYLVDTQGRETVDGQHLHGVAWDPWWDRIWVSFGDNLGGNGSNGIVYSDDLGETWQTAHYWTGVNPPHQVVGILPLPGCILFAGDMGPAMVRIDRTQGKHDGPYDTPVAWETSAPGKHLCQAIHKPSRVGDDSPALFAFSAEGAASPSYVVATRDGYSFTEVWRDDVNNPSGMGARNIVGPTLRGKVILASNDQKVSGLWSEVTMPAPGY